MAFPSVFSVKILEKKNLIESLSVKAFPCAHTPTHTQMLKKKKKY